ncbi:hypothetical protein ACLB2K_041342 [Fragaria x ananassa]
MVRSLLSARLSSRPSSAVKPPETATLVPKASPSSLLHCWIGGASSGAAVWDKSSSKTPPVRIRCRSNFSFLRSPFGHNKYFVTFLDDTSRKVWVYLLKSKNQVFQTFKEYHAMVERETGRTLKCLRSDNGGKYTSNEFRGYCSKHGIRHIKIVPGTPQHNGVAKRMNHTILEKVRSMLKTVNLAKKFWGEAVTTACYLINRTPCVPLGLETPESVWTGRSASYSHLRVFGCKAFAHVPKKDISKLDDKAIPCIFLGYGNEEMGYRLWNLITKKLFRNRDVVFHKDQTAADFDKTILKDAYRLTYDSSPLQEESTGAANNVANEAADVANVETEAT